MTSYQAAVGFFALLKVPAVAADEEVACGWGDSNAGERRNLEGRARPVFVVCIIPSRPLLLLAREPDPPRANLSKKHDCPTAHTFCIYSPCVSAIFNTLLHFASRPRRRLRYVSLHHHGSATRSRRIPADLWSETLAAQPPRDMRLPPIASNTGNSLRAKTGKRP